MSEKVTNAPAEATEEPKICERCGLPLDVWNVDSSRCGWHIEARQRALVKEYLKQRRQTKEGSG